MTKNANSAKLTVLNWLNEEMTPSQALYRLLLDEWEIPSDLVLEALGHEDDRSAFQDAVKTEDELFPPEDAATYYCGEHDFSTDSPQSWAAHHTHADHREEAGSDDENEGLGALFR